MADWGVQPAGGHVRYARAVPGSRRAASGDLGGAPYGRTEDRRARGRAGEIPGGGKGLKQPHRRERSLKCRVQWVVRLFLYRSRH